MAQWLNVSKSGYYAWQKRYPSLRDRENQWLLDEIRRIHEKYRHVYGSRKMTQQELNNRLNKPVNHKRAEHIIREKGIHSKVTKKYKATRTPNIACEAVKNLVSMEVRLF